ncbi:MAG: D-glycero-beta-D-manno-heptose-7-phosphate kinase [Cephaloticoccus sp.]|nr:D-glycero-beta-D-manno-heptose-7-phosphate kinase [Cephaloticoccus sp.]MCF7760007.1 D-glycero-beta-D-manno-heptose-7-phosphate kinase [Cephaloticoccus sp.]
MKSFAPLLKRIARLHVVVIGDVMLDHYIWGDATRISPEAPVPVVNIHRESDTVGGAANVAANIAALGAKVELCGSIGRDKNGDKLRQHLQANHIAYDARFDCDHPTITKTRVVVRNQQLCRLDSEVHPSLYRQSIARRMRQLVEKVRQADAVILSDYAKGTLSNPLIKRLVTVAHQHGKFIALDPKPSSGLIFAQLDLITPNKKEALEMAGLTPGLDDGIDPQKICHRLWQAHKSRQLVITLGADGMLLSKGGKALKIIPTAARQVFDVSGAGDTVIAALTLAMATGASLETAAHFANAAAGVVVGKFGTATVTPAELLAYGSEQS